MKILDGLHGFLWENPSSNNCNTFFIDGEKHVGGMSFETLSEKFDKLLRATE